MLVLYPQACSSNNMIQLHKIYAKNNKVRILAVIIPMAFV